MAEPLRGCLSRPLIGYLKSLGLLRVISRQADATVKGRWAGNMFELRSELDMDRLIDFFVHAYQPAAVVSPWNGGSGFHPKDSKQAILELEGTQHARFAPFRAAIAAARAALAKLGIDNKPQPEEKLALIRELRRSLPDDALPWLDSAIVVAGGKPAYPPLLGSGGNDARYDFANNYAQAVVSCLLSDREVQSAELLFSALEGAPAELQRKLSLGHLSRDSSPTNSPQGEADSLGNPWDLILAVEGSLMLSAGASRRHGATLGGSLVAPFTVYPTSAGYGSSVSGESGRAELWLPIWLDWASSREFEALARESRAQVGSGRSRRQARTGLDFARAAGQLGVARGIKAFERYVILERAGQSNVAVGVGRVNVQERPSAIALRQTDRWLEDVLRFGKSDSAPASVRGVARRLESAVYRLAARGTPADACQAIEVIGETESTLSRSANASHAGGLRPLRGGLADAWIALADDGTPEFAIAVSLASLHDRHRGLPALRDYLHGTTDNGSSFDPLRRSLVESSDPIRLLAAIHARRHIDAAPGHRSQHDSEDFQRGLGFEYGTWCDFNAIRMLAADGLVAGGVPRILRLTRGLALFDHGKYPSPSTPVGHPAKLVPLFDLLALAWWGNARQSPGEESPVRIGPRPGWATRLAAGALTPVLADAHMRLRMAGLNPTPTVEDLSVGIASRQLLGPRLSAALLLSLSPGSLADIERRIAPPINKDEQERSSHAR